MDVIVWIAKLAGLVMLVQYLVGPILVWMNYRHPARYRLSEGEPGVTPLDPTPAHSANCMALESLGFMRLQTSGLQGPTQARVTLFQHADGTIAYAASMQSGSMRLEYCEFAQSFHDGRYLVVNNSRQIMGLPEVGSRILYRLPQFDSPLELYAAWLQLLNKHIQQGRQPDHVAPDQVTRAIDDYMNAESARLTETGFFRASTPEQLRPTVKGALMLTWRQCFPVKQWIDYNDRAASKRALQL